MIKPGERQPLNVIVKIASEIENYFLFERVVKNDPKSVRQVLHQECHNRAGGQRNNEFGTVAPNRIIDYALSYAGKDDHHQRRQHGEPDRAGGKPGITSSIAEHAQNGGHNVTVLLTLMWGKGNGPPVSSSCSSWTSFTKNYCHLPNGSPNLRSRYLPPISRRQILQLQSPYPYSH